MNNLGGVGGVGEYGGVGGVGILRKTEHRQLISHREDRQVVAVLIGLYLRGEMARTPHRQVVRAREV